MICLVLTMEMLQGVWKEHLRPRAVVGYGVRIFLPSPPNYVTRSPGETFNSDRHRPYMMLWKKIHLDYGERCCTLRKYVFCFQGAQATTTSTATRTSQICIFDYEKTIVLHSLQVNFYFEHLAGVLVLSMTVKRSVLHLCGRRLIIHKVNYKPLHIYHITCVCLEPDENL